MTVKKIAVLLTAAFILITFFAGCGENADSEIVGKWTPSTVTLNGEKITYKTLNLKDDEFEFNFTNDGKCNATLAGINRSGTYTFNGTSVDVNFGNETQKLNYHNGNLTLTLNYDNNTTMFTFIKER